MPIHLQVQATITAMEQAGPLPHLGSPEEARDTFRPSPENTHPAALDDAYKAAPWVATNAPAIDGDASRFAVTKDSDNPLVSVLRAPDRPVRPSARGIGASATVDPAREAFHVLAEYVRRSFTVNQGHDLDAVRG